MTFPLLIGGAPSRYRINQSLRFRASNSAHLTRTQITPTSRRTFTFSTWFKRGSDLGVASVRALLHLGNDNNTFTGLTTDNSGPDRIWLQVYSGGGYQAQLVTNAVFRDPTAWYHVVLSIDTTQATAANRVRLYINGVEVTSFALASYPAQNLDLPGFANALNSALMRYLGTTNYLDGYLAETYFVDGQQLTPSSFGQTDPATNSWVPRRYTGTYGTNGFYLPFNDAASTTTISQDRSGNGNNWTSSGISVTAGATFDQMLDSPTNNFATLSPIDTNASVSFSEANLRATAPGGTTYHTTRVTQPIPDQALIYWEGENTANTFWAIGLVATGVGILGTGSSAYLGGGDYGTNSIAITDAGGSPFIISQNGANIFSTASSGAGNTYRFAYNHSNGRFWVGDAGGWFNSGNPAAGIGHVGTLSVTQASIATTVRGSGSVRLNLGQRPFAYTPPTGFLALNTQNLPTPTIPRGDDAFFAGTRTGTGASASVSSLRFQPDLVWIKSRSNATNHNLFDAVRGVQNGLVSNSNAAEYADANSLTAFNSNGYTLGTDGSSRGVNINTNTYVDWAWREGAAYGFDIVTFTKTTAVQNVAHALNAVPHMMVVKQRGALGSWAVYHRNMTASPQGQAMFLDLTSATAAYPNLWNGTAPTSSQFTVGSDYPNAPSTYVAYLWTSIPGFSLFGSYTGNGSADGPFVWCGFRPRFVMIKPATAAESWYMVDAARNTFNVADSRLVAESSAAEVATGMPVDFLSNGFKLRTTNGNPSGGTVIFAAFAEHPFKFANAR